MSREPDDEVRWRLERSEGFLLLEMGAAARAELEALPAHTQEEQPVRSAWLQLALHEKDWPRAAALAMRLRVEAAERPEYWIWEAFARRRCEGVAVARAVLQEARRAFPDIGVLAFNLACYACVEGDLTQARELLREAFQQAPQLAESAGEDEDLRPLWDELDALAAQGGGAGCP